MKLLVIVLCIGLMLLAGCSQKEQPIAKEILDAHHVLAEEINKYLIKNEAISGFGGEIFCDHKLIGGQEDELYIIFRCQEYYLAEGDKTLEGTGFETPAVVVYKGKEIKHLKRPKDGAAFSTDVNDLFPPNVARRILSNSLSTNWENLVQRNVFKTRIQERRK